MQNERRYFVWERYARHGRNVVAPVKREVTRERERLAWEYRQRGWTERRIAEELGVDESTVCRALKRIDARVLAKLTEEAERVKAAQTSQLEHMFSEAFAAWERSKEPLVIETVTSGRAEVTKAGALIELPDEVRREERQQNGDPRMLAEARGALADIRKLWGFDAPSKQEVFGQDGGPLVIEYVNDWRKNRATVPTSGANDGQGTGQAVQLAERGQALAEDDAGHGRTG